MKSSWIPCLVALFLVSSATASDGPTLSIPERIPGSLGFPVAAPVTFNSNGADVSTTVFSVDLDEECLEFDPIDDDPADGIPDDVILMLPPQFSGTVNYSAEDTDGELDFVIFDFGPPPLAELPDGAVAHIIMTPSCPPERVDILARVSFSADPAPSFGDTTGQGLSGTSSDGSIQIRDLIFADGFESGDTSAWSVTESNTRRHNDS